MFLGVSRRFDEQHKRRSKGRGKIQAFEEEGKRRKDLPDSKDNNPDRRAFGGAQDS